MSTIKAFIRRHPVTSYFALAFALSWGGVLLAIGGPGRIPGTPEQTQRLFPIVYLAMLVGPSVAGILLTALVRGRAGLRELLSRLLRWRVGSRWYAVALFTAPLVVGATTYALSRTSEAFLPGFAAASDKTAVLLFGLAVGLGAGFFEELGWTGFAVPEMKRRHGVFATGLVVGLVWGAWHFLVTLWGSSNPPGAEHAEAALSSGALPLALLLPVQLFSFLPAFRLLMVWVHDRTGSLLVAMLMHASLTASMLVLGPGTISGASLVAYDVAQAAVIWALVGAVALANHGHLTRPPLPSRAA